MMVEGLAMNTVTALAYSKTLRDLDLTECLAALIIETRKVQSGDMGGPEAMSPCTLSLGLGVFD